MAIKALSRFASEPTPDTNHRMIEAPEAWENGREVRWALIRKTREQLERGELDDDAKLDAALDRLAEDLGIRLTEDEA